MLASDESHYPNPGGFITTTAEEPSRCLNYLARSEFTDISYRALAELSFNPFTLAELVARAGNRGSLFLDLCQVVDQYHPRPLLKALEEAVGHPWRKAYNQAIAERPLWYPLPFVHWPI